VNVGGGDVIIVGEPPVFNVDRGGIDVFVTAVIVKEVLKEQFEFFAKTGVRLLNNTL